MPDPVDFEARPSTPGESTPHRIFFGDDGLRAGWSLLLFFVFAVAISVALNGIIAHFHLLPKPTLAAMQQDMRPRVIILSDGMYFTVLAVCALLVSLIERRPFRRYGLTPRRALTDVALGLLWGLFFLTALTATLLLTHHLAFDGMLLHGTTALSYGLKWGLAFVLVGLFEEFVFRGFLQYTIARGVAGIARSISPLSRHTHAIGFWVAAVLLSVLLFAGGHTGNPGETPVGIADVAAAGLLLVFSLWRTGSLWWAIGFHAAWDWSQSYLYGTPDSGTHAVGHLLATHAVGSAFVSGGSAGPEGSILALPALALAALAVYFTLPRRVYFLTPDQLPPPSYSGPVHLD